ncbi:lysoplasmalogenase [Streptomyces violens]|uniref:lysoplasmalogenase n=1 Tax=Streptomyces violens TaxID=66377 RepID=UPI00068B0D12|nr:lysoplasmalogenase [Streptomyces violens]
MSRDTGARVLLTAFGLLAAVHLGALLAGAGTVEVATKPALMPVLAAYVLARRGPVLLAAALLFGCGGDTLLQVGGDTAFLVGMASFAAGHVCYLVLFVRRGAAPQWGRRWPLAAVAAGYTAAWLGTVALLWPDLTADLRGPVAGYSLLLTAMAYGALRAGPRALLGGLLFLASDTLIASGLAHWPQPPAPQFCIMLGYLAAQWLLADGVLRTAAPAAAGPAASDGPARRAVVPGRT